MFVTFKQRTEFQGLCYLFKRQGSKAFKRQTIRLCKLTHACLRHVATTVVLYFVKAVEKRFVRNSAALTL